MGQGARPDPKGYKFNDALVWEPKAAEEGAQNGSVVTNKDGSASVEIVITDTGKGKLHNVVDVAGDVAEKLELVDPKVAAVVELGLAAAQGVKSAVKYVAEQAINNSALGDLWAKFTQDAGKVISDAATGVNQSDREWIANYEGSQKQLDHMDKGGTLLAGIGIGIAGSGGITAAIKDIGNGQSFTPATTSAALWRNPQTNNIEPLPEGVKIHQDHIYPKNAIEKLDGFDMLTPAQQRLLLNDPENLQPLPASLNCSKGCTIEGTEKSWNPK